MCIKLSGAYESFVSVLVYRPQTTVGTAMVLCHRFFVRRSHACHDRYVSFSSLVRYAKECNLLDASENLHINLMFLLQIFF